MIAKIDLDGVWELQLDGEKQGRRLPMNDTIALPGTTSFAKKGVSSEVEHADCLTDEYAFEGWAWYARAFDVPEELAGTNAMLYLERTRVTTVWIDGEELGTQNSLSAPHVYRLPNSLTPGAHTITIRVDNTDYPTKGGHMTSRDTQTNWNGITGRIELQFYGAAQVENITTYPNVESRTVTVKGTLVGAEEALLDVSAVSFNASREHAPEPRSYPVNAGEFEVVYPLGADALLWSEWEPSLYKLRLAAKQEESPANGYELTLGLREFKAEGGSFTINGAKTFLRGKHDGLIFPLTGFAPTTVEEWARVLEIAKSYGINHYRFHTCCPPEAAFEAADRLGIYMEPELPFWGTVTDETYENHNEAEQQYLIQEGYRMLEAFGNHPSFVMMSLGNELWGSKERVDGILKDYKAFDNRPLYTQGSNNFQWVPVILEHEDFFCGVRFSKDRLFRGSYAMCDAPQGHLQTGPQGTMIDYDDQIIPPVLTDGSASRGQSDGGEIQIQYGTEAKTVQADAAEGVIVPQVPVVSHEIGQYQTYPDFNEIAKYTGPLKARNFELFKQRLEEKGLDHLAEKYHAYSGRVAVEAYKEELEAAFRTKHLAGFQLLDLQDFSGQGTALVGVLDAFMDSKGLVSPEEWRTFCSDAVLLARFPSYNYAAGERFEAAIQLRYMRPQPLSEFTLHWELTAGNDRLASGDMAASALNAGDFIDIGRISFELPGVPAMTKASLRLRIVGTDIRKSYDLWIYPSGVVADKSGVHLFEELTDEAADLLANGERVVVMPKPDRLANAIEGTYCVDFWCYPMFRSISESMNKPVPVGTMGLSIDHEHPAFGHFASEPHSTEPWRHIVSHSRSIILDGTDKALQPIVQTIDNFERNHKLGMMFECKVGSGSLLVCALDAQRVGETTEGRQFLHSLFEYAKSEAFKPSAELELAQVRDLLR
ncbi:glycoside hydrolase family 2 TIM barrel-domain containing protein [Paenibacillus methanolicus]|uniref:Glycosyl hydrolase family 2 n=1 Tax=Paenibacillus methanolicus TaxID=582686 RepID=A0A5S5CKE9_9BACL|nr:glycoside hydrolase family 2 TIM barrel-domain containing protein [Paenibacillus methanolicus]TYP79205.1 glycosyl hydrolase family 2 [Paenibacillus methanolicus]